MEQNQKRESFVFYASWWEAIKDLPREIQGEVLTSIVEYGLKGVTTGTPKQITKAMLTLIKPQIDANYQRFMNGCKGGRGKKQNQTETKGEPHVNDNDNVNENVNDFFSPKRQKKAKKILFEKGLLGKRATEELERFISYNESKGWEGVKNKVAALKLWKPQKDTIDMTGVRIFKDFCNIAGEEFEELFLDEARDIYIDEDGITLVCRKSLMERIEGLLHERKEDFLDWAKNKKYDLSYSIV